MDDVSRLFGPEDRAVMIEQGGRLRRLREAMRMTQVQLGRAADLSHHKVSRMEKGETPIIAPYLLRIGRALNVSTEYVVTGRLAGLPDEIARLMAAVEARDDMMQRAS